MIWALRYVLCLDIGRKKDKRGRLIRFERKQSNALEESMESEKIAIIGTGCRFPGDVNDARALWELLVQGREVVTEVPPDRWNIEHFYDPEPGIAGKSMAKRGGFLKNIDQFDPQFFGISPREAPYIDPQQRLLLETAWEAIEDAGLVLDFERGTDLAVFVGISHNDYQAIQGTAWEHTGISAHSPTGSAHSVAANRISYCLNLRGPSVALDTACSSALTAVHVACEHLWAGRGRAALAGGVTVMITPGGFIGFSQAAMLSPEGRCKAFDASADGFVRGEGAGMVLLKRLSDALADGDPIQGVIVASAMNQDGHTNGISLPSPEAQARLVRDACAQFGIDPRRVGFVEAHGTGTAVGDPIEAHALAEALCANRPDGAPLPIGSVKTNLGHLETAAGVAGLLKAMLALKHAQIPPSLHFREPSPHIDFQALKLRVPTALEPFPAADTPRLAGVNSFGFGGANSHVILEEPPATPPAPLPSDAAARPWPLVLSARSENSLRKAARNLAGWIDEHMRSNGQEPLLPDLTYTLGARRNHHPYRLTLVTESTGEAIRELTAFSEAQPVERIRTAFSPRPEQAPRIGFVMSGQGPQWWGMGRELRRREPVFRRALEECAEALAPWTRFSLLEEMEKDEGASQMSRTEIAQPAIFAMQVALAELWKSWEVTPSAIVGHSVGEIAAACVAGILSLEEAARVIALRSRFMDECARGEGTMLAVAIDEETARAMIVRRDRTVTISAVNGPKSLTLAGRRASLEPMAEELESQGIFARFVRVDHPFHHPLMQPAAEQLEAALADLSPREEAVPFFSTVTGERCRGTDCKAGHWARGVRQPVLFAPAVQAISEQGVDVWLEIGAHPALSLAIRECLAARGASAPVIATARREHEHAAMLEAAMDLHRAGVPLDFNGLTPARNLLTLPTYPWDHSRWWHESSDWQESRLGPGGRGLLDMRLSRAVPTWVARLDGRHMAFLKDHKVENHVIFPAAAFVDMALEAGTQLFEGRPFVLEDFEIRRPLILPDSPGSVVLELTFDSESRTFSIQSRQGSAWSTHVVGALRGDRTEGDFASSVWTAATGLEALDPDGFYAHLHELGLRYGEEFRSVRELAAAGGKSSGRVALAEASARRSDQYPLHPVLLDGALHVFSAGAASLEGRGSRMKLPVRFARIQFLRSPGASGFVRAGVTQCSEELVEGDIALYDQSGQPCVLVEGFRGISLAAARRAGSSGGLRSLIYHVDWQRTSVDPLAPNQPPPLRELHAAASAAREGILAARGRDHLSEALGAKDDLAASQLAEALSRMGADGRFTEESLRVAPAMRAVFRRLMAGLAARRMLEPDGEGWIPTAEFRAAAAGAPGALRQYIVSHPAYLVEGQLCALTCAELGPILRGEKDAVQILFGGAGAELLEQFYGDGLFSSQWMAAISRAVQVLADSLPEGRGLRILEVGAGTGGLAAFLLPQLERGLHRYVFSDVSQGFFGPAAQKLAAFPEVEFQVYDLERPGGEQGLPEGTFDLVLATNVLHTAADLRAALKHVRDLLAPGGTLIFTDVACSQLWTETIFGLTTGWWRFADRDLRAEQPLLTREQWMPVLTEAGFAEALDIPGTAGPRGEGQMAILARKPWQESSREPALSGPAEKSWLIFADAAGLGERLALRLRQAHARCRIVRPGREFTESADDLTVRPHVPGDWPRLLSTCAKEDAPARLLWLWGLDDAPDPVLLGTDALLHLAQAIEQVSPTAKLRLDLVTCGAQPVGSRPVAVHQAPLIGEFRVLLNEHPNISGRAIDLPPEGADDLLWRELGEAPAERETVLRDGARYAPRITRGLPVIERPLAPGTALRLESRERGTLDALRLAPFAPPVPGPGQVLIEVAAAGMNFRDVLKALALYPAESPDARMFGDEVAGVVQAVGEGVRHVAPGDRVFGIAAFGLATQALARGGDIRPIPAGLTFEEAATLPVVFMTAWHAMQNVARLRRGESILVHAGAGGVGMAAIQLAQHLGLEVIATAGSPSKRALLRALGVKHVLDSRKGDFTDAVLRLTNRRGVDAVLNSLAGEAIPMGLACLAEFGRFIEIGKRDIYQNARIPLWPLRRNASFHVVAMDAVFNGDEDLTRNLLGEIAAMVEARAIRPLPFRGVPACRVDAAFRLMAQGKHVGKIVVNFAPEFLPRHAKPLAPAFVVRSDASYLITGGLGGFGRVLAGWLADCGAKHLVLTGRRGAATPEAEAFLAKLRERNVQTEVVTADVGSAEDLARLFAGLKASPHPLRGVFHLAMVIDDAPMGALTAERFAAVMAPKARGAWLLHEQTRDLALDHFVLFSSVSSIFGNPAQANYAAANAFLDALAHHRRALGLPALTVNWGVLGGAGYVARNERVAEFLARQGTASLAPNEVVRLIETFLADGAGQVSAIRVDWSKWRQAFRNLQENPLIERVSDAAADDAEGRAGEDWRRRLAAASSAEERGEVISQAVRTIIGSVLRVKPESLRDDQPLNDLGLDSLMGAEIETSLDAALGVGLPPTSLLRARTIGQICKLIAEHMGGTVTPSTPAETSAGQPLSSDDVDLEALSEDDITALLEATAKPEKN